MAQTDRMIIPYNYINKKSLTIWIVYTAPLWLLASVLDSVAIANTASVWGASICLYWLWSRIGNSFEMVRFLRISAVSLCALQNVAWLSASYIHHFSLNTSIRSTLKNAMVGGMQFDYYPLAVFYVTLFCAVISSIGSAKKIKKYEYNIYISLQSMRSKSSNLLAGLLTIFTAVGAALILTGVIGQRSIIVDGYKDGERPFWIVIYESILPAQIIISSLLLFQLKKKLALKIYWVILACSLFIFMYVYFTKGRSAVTFSIINFSYWYYFFKNEKPKFIKSLIAFLIIYPLFSQLLLFNNFIRGVNGYSDWSSTSSIDLLPEAWKRFRSSESMIEEEKKSTTSNLASRPLVAIPLALCLQYPAQSETFTYGENLFNSIIWAIPGPLIPNKKDYPVQEELLYKHFKIGQTLEQDTADSLYLSSFTEFSWFGLFIYPLLVCWLWLFVTYIFKEWKLQGTIAVITVAIFFQLFILGIGENSVSAWLVALRSFAFWTILYKLYSLVIDKRNLIETNMRLKNV